MDKIKHALRSVFRLLQKRRKYLPGVLALAFLILMVYFVYSNWDDFRSIDVVHPQYLILLGLFSMINLFSTGRIMDVVLHPLGLRLHPLESYGLAALSRIVNQVTPGQTGLILRATYLKKKYGLSITSFLSALASTHIFIYVVASVLGLISIGILEWQGTDIPILFTIALAGLFLILTFFVIIPVRLKTSRNRFAKHFINTINGWQTIKEDFSILFLSLFWSSVLLLSNAAMAYFAFNSLGATISPVDSLFIAVVMIAGGIISITPSGFGVNEALGVLGASGVGVESHIALTAVLLQRIVVTIVLYTTTPFISRWLLGTSLLGTIKKFREEKSIKPEE